MQEKRKVVGDITVCYLSGEININTSPDLRKVFDELITKKATKVAFFDPTNRFLVFYA